MPQVLTTEQEIEILDDLKQYDILDSGASRMCYEVGADFVRQYGVEIPSAYDELIIKVSLGLGGCNQTMTEITSFIENPAAPLATIFAYGKFVEVMEYVEVIDECFRDCDNEPYDALEVFFDVNDYETFGLISYGDWQNIEYHIEYNESMYTEVTEDNKNWALQYNRRTKKDLDTYHYWDGDWEAYIDDFVKRHDLDELDCEYSYTFCEKVYNAVCELIDINGTTCDNYQLGETIHGDLVAYDYGYVAYSGNTMCSDISNLIGVRTRRNTYIDLCIENLENEVALKQASKDMFSNIETDFIKKTVSDNGLYLLEEDDNNF